MNGFLGRITTVVIMVGLLCASSQATCFALEKQQRLLMDTYVTISANGPKEAVSAAIDAAFNRMEQTARKFNAHDPDSPLYLFNTQGQAITDPEIIAVVRKAVEASRQSHGAFDVTVYPLVKLWGFYTGGKKCVPQDEEIKETLSRIGYKHLIFSDAGLSADVPGVAIDLGGIAKGYAVSQGVVVLQEHGVRSAIIDAGGDIYALGLNEGNPWKVGIQDPHNKDGLLGYLEVSDAAVMGSGNYERFFTEGGKHYAHIIDPRTGYPAQGVAGATVIHPDPVVSDAWATALCVLEPTEGMLAAKNVGQLEAVVVTVNNKILYTSALAEAVKSKPKEAR